MKPEAAELTRQEIIRLCHSALDSRTLRVELLKRLRPLIPFDYVYFSTTDPATQLATGSVLLEEPPPWLMSVFIENEFIHDDFNKFSDMLKNRQAVAVLSQAAGGEPRRSPRYRDMLLPLAMADELRSVFVAGDACWGTLCLHRQGSPYTPAEADFAASLAPHIADGLRKALLISAPPEKAPDGPGVLVLADDLSIVAATAAAEYWLAEMETKDKSGLPVAIRAVVVALQALERGLATNTMPKTRIRTRSGHWLVIHASRLRSARDQAHISVIFELAQPAEIAPLMMQAYQLTKREGEITQCVLLGWSTAEIAARLYISSNTVQDHLKAIFEKVDVSSRGELAARIFTQHYQPLAGAPLASSGQFIRHRP
jgi:DNA-binding NarL/FixJ family response regulator